MTQDFNVDWKAECGQLNLANVTKTKEYKKKKLYEQTPVPSKSGPSDISVKIVQMEPERLWRKGFVKQMSFKSGEEGEGAIDGEW